MLEINSTKLCTISTPKNIITYPFFELIIPSKRDTPAMCPRIRLLIVSQSTCTGSPRYPSVIRWVFSIFYSLGTIENYREANDDSRKSAFNKAAILPLHCDQKFALFLTHQPFLIF